MNQLKPLMFGDNALDADRLESSELYENWDNSYIQGYSEQKRENDIRISKGQPRIPMDRLQWIRTATQSGQHTGMRDRGPFQRLGYQFVTGEHAEDGRGTCNFLLERGWGDPETGVPTTAYVAPDGTIRREDSALAVVGSERAERNRQMKDAENQGGNFIPLGDAIDSHQDESYVGLDGFGDGSLSAFK